LNTFTGSWRRFWFDSQPTSTLALVRVAFGAVVFAWTLALLPSLSQWFGTRGILPAQPGVAGTWGVLAVFPQHGAVVACAVALLVSSACLLVGYRTRLAAALVFIGLISFERRNPFVFDSGDALLRIIALLLALAPTGTSVSLDRRRRAPGRLWEFPCRAAWPLRLLQVQLTVIYLATVWAKARGVTWNDGTAVSYALRITDLNRLPVPHALAHSLIAANLMTYGTLAIELALATLVWNRRARPWVLGLGIALHLGIEYSIKVGFFTLAMLVLYIAFVPPEAAARFILATRRELARLLQRAHVRAPAAVS
jgi:hypothetical protein